MSPGPHREQLHRWYSAEGERLGLLWELTPRRGCREGAGALVGHPFGVCPFFTTLRFILKWWERAGEVTDSSSRGPEFSFRYP